MTKRLFCIFFAALFALCALVGCGKPDNKENDEDTASAVNEYESKLVGVWEYSDESGDIRYTFASDKTGLCNINDYELPFTFTADSTNLTLVTDYISLYEELNDMSFEELVENGYVDEALRYITERYTYTISEDTLSITDIAYSQLNGADMATLELTKAE